MFFSRLFVSKAALKIIAVALASRVLVTSVQIIATQLAPTFDHSVDLLFVGITCRYQSRNRYTRNTRATYQNWLSSSIGMECTKNRLKSTLVTIWAFRSLDITLRRMELSSLFFHGFSDCSGVV